MVEQHGQRFGYYMTEDSWRAHINSPTVLDLAVETPFRMDKFVGAPESKITGRRLVYYGAPTAPERLNEDSPYA